MKAMIENMRCIATVDLMYFVQIVVVTPISYYNCKVVYAFEF